MYQNKCLFVRSKCLEYKYICYHKRKTKRKGLARRGASSVDSRIHSLFPVVSFPPSLRATAQSLNINAARHLFCRQVKLTLDFENGLGKTADVLAGDASNGDAAVLGGVDGELGGELGHLESAHGDDAVGHGLELGKPLLAQLGVGENGRGDAGAVDGRVRVDGANDDLELGVDALLLGGVLADNGKGTNTLTIETLRYDVSESDESSAANQIPYHVLGEGLAQGNIVALLDKVADSKGVLVNVATGKSLIGHVEEGKVALLLGDLGELLPLLLRWVDTGGVEDAALGGGLDVGDHALKIEANGVLVVVAVLLDLEASVGEDGLVGGRVLAIGELGSQGRKLGNTGDAGVLLVQLLVNDLLLSFTNGGQDIGLSLVIAVSANACDGVLACYGTSWAVSGVFSGRGKRTEVDLLVEAIGLESFSDACKTCASAIMIN
ncbi:hypothetical protein LLEC1_00024 [Akanthomyces lecanii]|uniref:Uncharacterized protein n=1 Tax=Cordyceps confragosa TaxID=2714763 RepID=A0A179I8R5_CORDF|nr:hypothetical protein LLEC1_00024 [Akanthomyces lecanii]